MLIIIMIFSTLWRTGAIRIIALQASTNYTCENGVGIPIEMFCDGVKDCGDGSDERSHNNNFQNNQHKIQCRPIWGNFVSNESCLIDSRYICDGDVVCDGITPCDVNCPSYYRCLNTSQCFPRSSICDGDSCNGCAEDHDWGKGTGFFCIRNGKDCILPQQLLLDDIKDCDSGEDLCFVTKEDDKQFNNKLCFKCLQHNTIIPRSKVCDRVIDCPDLSDECLCEGKVPAICEDVIKDSSQLQKSSRECKLGDVRCGDGHCILRSSVCDGIKDCDDLRDESFEICEGTLPCSHGTYREANQTCRCDRPCKRAYGVLCDGKGDCPIPISDDRRIKWTHTPGYPDDECRSSCFHPSVPKFECTTPDVYNPLDISFDVIFCQAEVSLEHPDLPPVPIHQTVNKEQICDGIVHCPLTEEDESEEKCIDRFRCPSKNKISIELSRVCDGFPDCDDFSDEINNECRERFFCPSLNNTMISIDRKLVCDFIINCDDGSDERECHNDERFYCENGSPLFVTKRKVFDGRGDCSDWSDECPTQTKPPDEDIFSSRYELIANPILRILVWIMGVAAICGNLCVLFGESRKIISLRKKPVTSSTLLSNHLLVFNLAVADLLMGIYLITLGVVGIIYSGTFCSHKLEWLSSLTCSALGILVMTSSETSVVTMVLLTSFRLHAVRKPFQSSDKPKISVVLAFILLSWTCSLSMAFIPLFTYLEDLFTHKVLLYDNPFLKNIAVDFQTAKNFVEKLEFYGSATPGYFPNESYLAESWMELRNISANNTNYTNYLMTSRRIGYYSGNSVCIPKLFVTPDVAAWSFSFCIMLFNFLAFVYVTLAYAMIFIISKQTASISKPRSRRAYSSNALQRRIIRLIATDFCCWVPVSIMTFLNFSGIQLPEIAYVISAAVLLPINSALNPILYSNFLDRYAERAWNRTTSIGSALKMTSLSASKQLSNSSTRS